MPSKFRAALVAGAILLGAGPIVLMPQPAVAQEYVSFDYFHGQLAGYGAWLYSDRWGMVWQPDDVPPDFRPYYTDGHWVYTSDYGWMWNSDYDWGDIPFHYGRWVNDPDDGWLWIPGYTWAPSWVVWRTNNEYVGWMPMPPDPAFIDGAALSVGGGGVSISFGWNNDPYYGYRRWYGGDYDDRRFASNWVFVGYGHVADRDYGRYAVRDPGQTINIVRQTTTVVNYTVVNNYVVNKGIDVHRVEQVSHRPVAVVTARQAIRRPDLIASIAAGQRAQVAARAVAPRGQGIANSAPPPPPQVVQRLSAQPPKARAGRPPTHLFAKSEVGNPTVVASHFHGKPAAVPDTAHPAGMGGPAPAHPAPPPADAVHRADTPHKPADLPQTSHGGAPDRMMMQAPQSEINRPRSGPAMTPPENHVRPPVSRSEDEPHGAAMTPPEKRAPRPDMERPRSGPETTMAPPQSHMRPPVTHPEMEPRGPGASGYGRSPGGEPKGGPAMTARPPQGGVTPNRGPAARSAPAPRQEEAKPSRNEDKRKPDEAPPH
ncbi:DUF6600 domain-containing protein [Rhizomicrobium electricum]|uniref:Uncharacterized protein n=1 Tax=Rhizomicrobium electricum TaxID=480070 RepID=A0ABP3PCB3_9PROT|nr:DUF6600 domain-containing protein [Rhizomicrobium electricum]NIJ48688.1 hypothetical protein [Rhizomicrobium electricum]